MIHVKGPPSGRSVVGILKHCEIVPIQLCTVPACEAVELPWLMYDMFILK
jgi:hypothetical protein